jgi:circadian clock protein KaiC
VAKLQERHMRLVAGLPKARSGIRGLDEITGGGLPRGRPTLVCGNPGAGKTLFSVEFLVRGIEMGEPGVFVSFEETAEELAQNVASLGFDLERPFEVTPAGAIAWHLVVDGVMTLFRVEPITSFEP